MFLLGQKMFISVSYKSEADYGIGLRTLLNHWSTKFSIVYSYIGPLRSQAEKTLLQVLLPRFFNWRCLGLNLKPPTMKV